MEKVNSLPPRRERQRRFGNKVFFSLHACLTSHMTPYYNDGKLERHYDQRGHRKGGER